MSALAPDTRITLPPEQVSALNERTRVQVYWAQHDAAGYCDPINYDRVTEVVDRLDPVRGDRLVSEGVGFYSDQPIPYPDIHDPGFIAKTYGLLRPGDELSNEELLGLVRDARAVDAFRFAILYALQKGITVNYADADSEQLRTREFDIRTAARTSRLRHLGIVGIVLAEDLIDRKTRPAWYALREVSALQHIGNIALNMSTPSVEPPVMAVLWGGAHEESFGGTLTANGIEFESHNIMPFGGDPTIFQRASAIRRSMGH